MVTIPLATTVQVNVLLPCMGGHSVELSVTEHALSKSWDRVNGGDWLKFGGNDVDLEGNI